MREGYSDMKERDDCMPGFTFLDPTQKAKFLI